MKRKFMRNNKAEGSPVGWIVLGFVVAIALAAVFVPGAIQQARMEISAPRAGASAGLGGTEAPATTQVGLAGRGLTDTADMQAWNDKIGKYLGEFDQATNLNLQLQDASSGATVTTDGFLFFRPTAKVQDVNQPVEARVVPGTENTASNVKAEGYYIVAYRDPSNTYYAFSYCDPEGTQTATPCQIPPKRNANLARATWPVTLKVRAIGAIADSVEEAAAADSRNNNWANGQANITEPAGVDAQGATARCLQVGGTDALGGPADGETTNDGDVIWFNRTSCANFYYEFAFACGGTSVTSLSSNQWCVKPVMKPTDRHTNMSSNEVDSVTLTHLTGTAFNCAPGDVTGYFTSQRPIPLYCDGKEWVQSASTDWFRLNFATNTNWANGECYRIYGDDQGDYQGWLLNSSTQGSAAQSHTICRLA